VRATVKDVAERAAVSPKTVSNVLNGTVFVRQETVDRVRQAIDELDYVPNLSARSLRTGRSGVIALSLPDLGTPYSAEMLHLFVEAAHKRGWMIQIEETAAQPTRERLLVDRAREHLIDGLILNPVTFADSAVEVGVTMPPAVLIGEVEQSVIDQVGLDSFAAARDMTAHLLACGFGSIAAVGTPDEGNTSAAAVVRRDGYRAGLADAGIEAVPHLEVPLTSWTPLHAAVALNAFLDSHPLPDAFFCFTDSTALAVIGALWQRGIRVPHDVAVAGFDDLVEGRHAAPPLTTVGFDKRFFAERAIDLLVSRISHRDTPPVRVIVPHSIVARASTAAHGSSGRV
jgi:DNA-binding LacI/PurR family transcriptional regulator